MTAYYNENDPRAAAALRLLATENIIAPGHVDERSIKEVTADDLRGFTQCHFFAGAGLWSVAARLAGWPDGRPIWTASCPCQPFSNAGRRAGEDDPRHLWPDLLRVLRGARAAGYGPPVIVGEQVSGAAGYGWFDGVRADLASESYAGRSRDVPACSVDAPHERNRLWWVAVAESEVIGCRARLGESGAQRDGAVAADRDRRDELLADGEGIGGGRDLAQRRSQGRAADGSHHAGGATSAMGDSGGAGLSAPERDAVGGARRRQEGRAAAEPDGAPRASAVADGDVSQFRREPSAGQLAHDEQDARTREGHEAPRPNGSWWADAEWIVCHDGKARRTKPGLRLLVDGMVGRIDLWRLAGNSIVPVLAAEVIASILDAEAMMGERA